MTRTLTIAGRSVTYTLRAYRRSRTLRLSVHADGRIAVSTPPRIPLRCVEEFLQSKGAWLLTELARIDHTTPTKHQRTAKEMARLRLQAREIVEQRLAYFNTFYQHEYKKITIRNQRTRWGSCSKTGNLNFNYRIALLTPHLADYIVVHELCHVKAFNHSAEFWNLVAQRIPEYRACKQELRSLHLLKQ
jgi:predicted metal-dependent hydrolase